MGVASLRADGGENSEDVENVCADDLSDVCSRVECMEREGDEDMPELICQDGWADADQLEASPCFSSLGRDVTPETTQLRGSQNLLDEFTTSRFDSDQRQNSLGRLRRLVDYSDSESEEEEEEEEDIQVGGGGGGNPLPITDYYDLTCMGRTYVKKFRVHGKAYSVNLNHANIDQLGDLEPVLIDMIRAALEDIYAEGDPTDKIGMTFEHPGLRKGCYHIPFQLRSELTPEIIFRILESLIGYDEINLDSDFRIRITRIPQTRGGSSGGKKKKGRNPKTWKQSDFMKKHSRSFVQIHNSNDNLCFPRAVVTAKALRERNADLSNKDLARRWENVRKGDQNRYTAQKRLAEELAREAGLQDHEGPYGEQEIRAINDVVKKDGYQIKIFSSRCMNFLVYEGDELAESDDKVLHIYCDYGDDYDDNSVGHFIVCTKPHVLFGKWVWCDKCNRGFNDKQRHRCISKCNCCYSLKMCDLDEWKYCNDCNRRFRSQACFENHIRVSEGRGANKKKRIMSVCQKFRRCKKCERVYSRVNKRKVPGGGEEYFHKCGHHWCFRCKDFHEDGTHVCFMQPIVDKKKKEEVMEVDGGTTTTAPNPQTELAEPEEEQNDEIYNQRNARIDELVDLLGDNDPEEEETGMEDIGMKIFFDFESSQQRVVGQNQLGNIVEHVPNYCVARKVCMKCQDAALKRTKESCVFCGPDPQPFEGTETKKKFCEWLFNEKHQGATAIAHNAKGYDSQFLIQYLVKEAMCPKVVMKGTEFMLIQVNDIRIIDSLNFFPMGLAELPKAFNLTELKKGFFPHKFNTPENWDYVGKIPDAFDYDTGNMKEKKRAAFYEWYKDEKERLGENFNFHEELAAYCMSDVDILLRSCLQFEKDVVDLVDIKPFDVAITIASFCMKLFRKKFLKKNTIGLIPHTGYRGRENQSKEALRWLKWISEEEDIEIQHAGNGYEKRIGKYKVDGFHAPTNTVYEFNGCVWHGCLCQRERKKKVPNSGRTFDDAYEAWLTKKNYLESQGYKVVELWECDYSKELIRNPQMKQFVDSVPLPEPLQVSEALRGGRTNANRLYYKCKRGERMDYVDVVSLYPWGVKYAEFPKGHPKIITENFKPITAEERPYFGVIRCEVLPPKKLLHPILPCKSGGKLMFPLCWSCAESQRKGFCTHNDAQRSFTGEFVSTELYKSLEMGYKVTKIYEVWHYEETEKYDGTNEETGLFTKYINFFLKLKIEASGWPKWVKSEGDKKKFLDQCKEREGIDLDPSKIEKNPGKRQIAKLCLNSFWGKFGQRSNMTNDVFVNRESEFSKIMFDQQNVVENVQVVNEEVLLVSYRRVDEFVDLMPHMNKVIAAFTTANCRLRLYEELERLGDRVCYYDTDSVIYLTRSGDTYHPRLGSFLGDMTDELEEYGPGSYIDEFVSGGPKNYGFRVRLQNGKTETKVKIRGFTLSYHAANKLNMGNLKRKVFEFVRGDGGGSVTTIVQPQIARTNDRRVVTKDVAKKYGIVYDKRWVQSDFSTLPYGTCNV